MKILSAGEASGDLYAAALARAIRARLPESAVDFFGCTGHRLREEGVRTAPPASPPSGQNSSFSPNWICRGALAWLVITPKAAEVTVVFGLPNCARLKALKNSARN